MLRVSTATLGSSWSSGMWSLGMMEEGHGRMGWRFGSVRSCETCSEPFGRAAGAPAALTSPLLNGLER